MERSTMATLPTELLVYIFAIISYKDRAVCQLVCKYWNEIMMNDGTWRAALEYHYRSVPVNKIIESSWKLEYLARIDIELTWKSPLQHILFDPLRRWTYDRTHMQHDNLYIGSLEGGLAISCIPRTGKTSRDTLFVSEEQLNMQISALEFSDNIVVAGTLDGRVLFSKFGKTQNWGEWTCFNRFHDRKVTQIAVFPLVKLILSSSFDGAIMLWDYHKRAFICQFNGSNVSINCMCLSSDFLIAGSVNERVFKWKLPTDNVSVREPEVVLHCHGTISKIYHDQAYNSCIMIMDKAASDIIRYDLLSNSFMEYETHHTHPISSSFYYPNLQENRKSILLLGDQGGDVSVWINPFAANPKPTYILKNHIASISCLFYSSHIMATGSVDGTVFVIDTISFKVLGALNSKYRHGDINERRIVSHLNYSNGVLVSIQGNTVHSWTKKSHKAIPVTPNSRQKKVSIQYLKSSGGSQRSEFRTEVNMAMQEIEKERKGRQLEKNRVESINGNSKVHGMADEDLVAYAMLLSMEGSSDLNIQNNQWSASEQESLDLALALSLSEQQ